MLKFGGLLCSFFWPIALVEVCNKLIAMTYAMPNVARGIMEAFEDLKFDFNWSQNSTCSQTDFFCTISIYWRLEIFLCSVR